MSERATEPQPVATPLVPERTVYEASGGRKTIFSLVFLLLLPFFASLGPMLYQRLANGRWQSMAGFIIFPAGFTLADEIEVRPFAQMIAVDNDRDNTIELNGQDRTSGTKPFLFWLNDNRDVWGGDEYLAATSAQSTNMARHCRA